MTHEQYVEAVHLLDQIETYSVYMGQSHNADEWQRNFVRKDDARQKLLVILKELTGK